MNSTEDENLRRGGSAKSVGLRDGERRDDDLSGTQLPARHQNIAGDLARANREFVAEADRGGGIALEHT
jgi:hypothetical protein